MKALPRVVVEQFGRPSGLLGRLAGLVMRNRPSNRVRILRTLDLLDVQPADHVLEIGFGPGLGIARAAELAHRGRVVGIDHSELMVREASRHNARAMAEGRVELRLGSAEALAGNEASFDRVFAVNVFMFWPDPGAVLRHVRSAMKPGAAIALTLQPRLPGASDAAAAAAGERMAAALRDAGYGDVRIELLRMKPVDAACVLARAHRPIDERATGGARSTPVA